MVAGALCEFIAVESSTYERWLRFESSEKKDCPSVNFLSIQIYIVTSFFFVQNLLLSLSLSLSLSQFFYSFFIL